MSEVKTGIGPLFDSPPYLRNVAPVIELKGKQVAGQLTGWYDWNTDEGLSQTSGSFRDMKTTVTAAEAKTQFARLLREVEAGETVAISKRDQTVAFLVPRARMEALVETLEILGNAAAMKAVRQHDAGKLSFHPLSALDEDEG